jgi:hypothetical protein
MIFTYTITIYRELLPSQYLSLRVHFRGLLTGSQEIAISRSELSEGSHNGSKLWPQSFRASYLTAARITQIGEEFTKRRRFPLDCSRKRYVHSNRRLCIGAYSNEQEGSREETAETANPDNVENDPTRLPPTTEEILRLCPRQVAVITFMLLQVDSSCLQVPNPGHWKGVDTIMFDRANLSYKSG